MRSFSAILWFYISLTLSPPTSVSSTCFVNSLSICSVTATSELLVCVVSSYVHDSLVGRVIRDRQGAVAGKPNPRGERLSPSASSSP